MPEPLSHTVIKTFTIPETQTAHDKQGFLVYYMYAKSILLSLLHETSH